MKRFSPLTQEVKGGNQTQGKQEDMYLRVRALLLKHGKHCFLRMLSVLRRALTPVKERALEDGRTARSGNGFLW